MKNAKLVLASFALAFSLQSFAQETETALAILTDNEFTESSSKTVLEKEILKAKRNKTTKNANFRANATYVGVGNYLNQNLEFPDEARAMGISGKVRVVFDVLPNGRIDNIEVLESPLDLFSDQLISVIKSMPKWSPAFRNGDPVKSSQQIHVNFRLP